MGGLDPTALGLPFLTLFADGQTIFPEGYLVLWVFLNASWSVKTVALNLSLTACCIFLFLMTCRKQNRS